MNIFISSIAALSPGAWDCIGLSNSETHRMYAYDDDWDESVGQIPYDACPGDSDPDGPGVHAG